MEFNSSSMDSMSMCRSGYFFARVLRVSKSLSGAPQNPQEFRHRLRVFRLFYLQVEAISAISSIFRCAICSSFLAFAIFLSVTTFASPACNCCSSCSRESTSPSAIVHSTASLAVRVNKRPRFVPRSDDLLVRLFVYRLDKQPFCPLVYLDDLDSAVNHRPCQ